MTQRVPFVAFTPSNTSLYFPRPIFLTTCRALSINRHTDMFHHTTRIKILSSLFLYSNANRRSDRWPLTHLIIFLIPPLHCQALVVPVLLRPVHIDIGVYPAAQEESDHHAKWAEESLVNLRRRAVDPPTLPGLPCGPRTAMDATSGAPDGKSGQLPAPIIIVPTPSSLRATNKPTKASSFDTYHQKGGGLQKERPGLVEPAIAPRRRQLLPEPPSNSEGSRGGSLEDGLVQAWLGALGSLE
jgi:hypothetical protein